MVVTPEIPSTELVQKAKHGDKEAFGMLYDRFVEQIYRFIYFKVNSKEEAEDLTEHTFLTAFKRIASYEVRGVPFEAWLYTIARNAVIDQYRTKKKTVSLESAVMVEDKKKRPDESAEIHIMYETVLRYMKTLPPSYQEILVLSFIEDLDTKTIQGILNKPGDQVRVLKQRALQALKTRMKIHI